MKIETNFESSTAKALPALSSVRTNIRANCFAQRFRIIGLLCFLLCLTSGNFAFGITHPVEKTGGSPISLPSISANDTIRVFGALLEAGGTFAWKKDGYTIAGATGSNYTPAEPGLYTLEFAHGDTVTLLSVDLMAEGLEIIADLPEEENQCGQDSYTLRMAVTGSIWDYTWYKDGVVINGATADTLDVTESGVYKVRVNGVLDTIYSTETTVTLGYSPKIVTDLRDTIISALPATLAIEVVGNDLSYQWYQDGIPIKGAVSERIHVREEGEYYVIVSNACGSVESYHTTLTLSPFSGINRGVMLPYVEGLQANLPEGMHYVLSRNDFVFEMWPSDGYSLDHVTISTDMGNHVKMEPIGYGRIRVTIKVVNAEIQILIGGVSPVSNQQLSPDTRVWGHSNKLYISLSSAQEIFIYTLNGTLYNRYRLPEGNSTLSLPSGIYIIRFSDGTVKKLTINAN